MIIKKLVRELLTRKVTIAKWQLNLFGVICISIGLVFGSYFTLKGIGSIFATTSSSITVGTDTQFNQGTKTATAVTGTGNGAVLGLAASEYKRTLTINNNANRGLVGYWNMDEANGATAADTSGSGNNGTATGTTIDTGKFGNARVFNGISDKVGISTYNNLPLGNSAMTISAWFKITGNYNVYQSIFSWGGNTNGQRVDFFYDGTTGKLGAENCNASSMFAWSADANWHHMVVVVPANSKVSGQQIYLDGVLKTGTLGGSDYQLNITANGPYAGALNGSIYYLTGAVDEARIFNRTLSSTEVQDLFNNNTAGAAALSNYQFLIDEGEVAYWKMDEASGTTVADISGNGLNGTSTGTSITNGKWGNSRILNGSNQYVNVTNDALKFGYNQSFTISSWVYKEAASVSYAAIFAQQAATSGYFSYALQEDGNGNICANVGRYMVASYGTCAAMPLTTWTNVAMTYSGNTVTLYMNGSPTGTATYPAIAASAPNSSAYIGNDSASASNRWWNGRIDEVRVYNRALSPAEMSFLNANNQSPLLGSVYATAQENGNDLRFKDSDDSTALSYWVENFTAAGQNARVFVKVPTIDASTTKNINLYYGSGGSAQSNGFNTFDFFDDFEDGNYDGWAVKAATNASWDVVNGVLVSNLNCNGCSNDYGLLGSNYDITDGIVEASVKLNDVAGVTNVLAELVGRSADSWTTGYSNTIYKYPSTTKTNKFQVLHTSTLAEQSWSYNYNQWYKLGLTLNGSLLSSCINGIMCLYANNSTYASGKIALSHYQARYGASYDNVRVRKYTSSVPVVSAVGTETAIIGTSGTWESAADANVLDTIWNGGWGDGSDGSTAFSATVANVGSDNTITLQMRTAASAGGLSSAEYKTLGIINSGTTFTKTKADLDALGLTTGANRYIQVKATFAQTNGTNPQLDGFTISYLSDNTPPEVNATGSAMLIHAGGGSIASNGWTNDLSPYFSWTAGTDSQSNIKGYCLYLGTDPAGNPATSKGLLGTSPVSTTGTTCQFIVSGNNLDTASTGYKGDTWITTSSDPYYLNIKAIDNNNNISTTSHQFPFHYDNVIPTNLSYISCASGNFSNVVDMNFSWPTSGGSAANDTNAGIGGWQYQINSSAGAWQGTTHDATFNLDYIPATASAYTLVDARDGDDIVSGANVIYFRSVDVAGNVSNNSTVRTCNLSYGGAAPSFGGTDKVTITPSSATSNSFALSWPEATAAFGQIVANYYYMINTSPPSTLSTLQNNDSTYINNGTDTTVSAAALPNVNKGTNTIYVVAVDNAGTPNYSPSNYISGTFTLNSTDPDNVGNLVASDSSIKSSSQWNVTLTWTAPSYQGAGNLTYIVKRSTDNSTFTQVGTSTGLSYVDNTPASANYYYKVFTKDGANALSSGTNAVSITPTGKWTSAPSLDTGPTAGSITTKKATIEWTTSRSADSKIAYGTTSGSYGSDEVSNSDQTSSHEVNLTNLKAGTKYYYVAKWTDEDGNTGTSDENSFTTTSAPIVKNVSARNIGLTSAIIQYTVKDASKVKIYYGSSTSFGGLKETSTSSNESTYTTELSGLSDGVKYYYKINKYDSEEAEYEGDTYTFETLPRPKISGVRLETVANTAQTTIKATWNTNTEVSSIVTYYPEGNTSAARDEVKVALEKGIHTMTIRGLLPQTRYVLAVRGRDKMGNEAASDTQTFTTATDTRPPLIANLKVIGGTVPPVGFAAGEVKAQLIVSWDTDEPSTGQVEFGQGSGTTYSQRSQFDGNLATNHTVILSGLVPSQVYHLRAISQDSTKNEATSIDLVTIAPKVTRSAMDLVVKNLTQVFNIGGTGKK